ncbi:tyrosine-type recombinase/integrase [Senegalia massiliensis]|uniref:tyrosine-type recombinase/integrase n=1 Tax=Senegalia massiliensis TaxID=1720316 RepID=UPI0010319391|nr:tyrosine-type recombinase/integrase [Senegalia massiliensis]
MKLVDPIRDIKKINAMKNYLKGKDIRDYTMFVLGINIALRISDLLNLKWSDVLKENKRSFKEVNLIEKKTKKERKIKLNKTSQKALRELLNNSDTLSMDDYIFKSREGNNKPLTRQQALNILKNGAKVVGIEDNVGTHTLRKTWGYHAWKNGFNPALIMENLNHSNLNVTKRYLGIRQDDINDLYDSLNI